MAKLLRMVARIARDIEASAYRRLRDMEMRAAGTGEHCIRPGAPRRVREAFRTAGQTTGTNGDARIH